DSRISSNGTSFDAAMASSFARMISMNFMISLLDRGSPFDPLIEDVERECPGSTIPGRNSEMILPRDAPAVPPTPPSATRGAGEDVAGHGRQRRHRVFRIPCLRRRRRLGGKPGAQRIVGENPPQS